MAIHGEQYKVLILANLANQYFCMTNKNRQTTTCENSQFRNGGEGTDVLQILQLEARRWGCVNGALR